MPGVNFQREVLNEALSLFDQIRSQTANNPNVGVREIKALLLIITIYRLILHTLKPTK